MSAPNAYSGCPGRLAIRLTSAIAGPNRAIAVLASTIAVAPFSSIAALE
jgi:hypothetical protein